MRSTVIGWVALLAITYLLEHSLLIWVSKLVGASWFATVQFALECLALAGTGWIVGYLNRSGPAVGVLVFAATLTPWDFGQMLHINVPWLVKLVANTFRDPRYFDSVIATAGAQILLFGSLIGGGLFRQRTKPVSITTDD